MLTRDEDRAVRGFLERRLQGLHATLREKRCQHRIVGASAPSSLDLLASASTFLFTHSAWLPVIPLLKSQNERVTHCFALTGSR